jgi:hypothetical protein
MVAVGPRRSARDVPVSDGIREPRSTVTDSARVVRQGAGRAPVPSARPRLPRRHVPAPPARFRRQVRGNRGERFSKCISNCLDFRSNLQIERPRKVLEERRQLSCTACEQLSRRGREDRPEDSPGAGTKREPDANFAPTPAARRWMPRASPARQLETRAAAGIRPVPTSASEATELPLGSFTSGDFEMLGLPLLEGRDYRSNDVDGAPPVAIVNQAFGDRYFPDTSTLGRSLEPACWPAQIYPRFQAHSQRCRAGARRRPRPVLRRLAKPRLPRRAGHVGLTHVICRPLPSTARRRSCP